MTASVANSEPFGQSTSTNLPALASTPLSAVIEVARPASPEIQIGGKTFIPEDISALRSEDHYLTVVTTTRKILVRARLAETVAKLDPRHGVQISRSCWVAFWSIAELRAVEGGLKVVLQDGSEETVATVRRHAVRSAYDIFSQGQRSKTQ